MCMLKFRKYFPVNVYFFSGHFPKLLTLNIRKQLNLSQEKFGKILNLNQRTYASYENNKRTINILILLNIAKKFNYSLDYLIGRNNQKSKRG